MIITIRKETEQDYKTVENITREAFWNLHIPGCDEHYLAHILRTHPDFLTEMDFVAEVDNKVVGSIMYTKSYVVDENNKRLDTLTFGPLCVLPEFQKKGVGTSLINYTKKIAVSNHSPAIIILGHPYNYCKHGFKNCIDYLISDSSGKYPYGQLVLELEKGVFEGKRWKFFYSSAYSFDEKSVEAFDALFPYKSKNWAPSQEEFFIACRAYLG
ncbi:MAG TPA: N-acetyltransferase [Chitinispirillaceae bacterium]|nr:N-acetyltransferase [Chitinispirillaceae bacterium]